MKKHTHNLQEPLVSLGLSQNEAAVFIVLLEGGRSSVSAIARKSGISRVNGYVILDALIHKGLARISGKEPKQEYEAESPDNLSSLLKVQRAEIDSSITKAESLALQLKSIQKKETRSQVKFYEGTEGLKQVYEDTLTATEDIRAYASYEDVYAGIPNYFPKYFYRRAGKGIRARGIFTDTSMARERAAHDKEEARESVLVSTKDFGFHPEINIYNSKIMIASWREKLGIIIESAEIADAMKKIFELAWIGAKQLEKTR